MLAGCAVRYAALADASSYPHKKQELQPLINPYLKIQPFKNLKTKNNFFCTFHDLWFEKIPFGRSTTTNVYENLLDTNFV